jgi:Helix-turn-helix domain
LNQWAGSLRFLWNRLLEREKAEYQATGKLLWREQLQPIAVGMKRQGGMEWLADLPAHAVLPCQRCRPYPSAASSRRRPNQQLPSTLSAECRSTVCSL